MMLKDHGVGLYIDLQAFDRAEGVQNVNWRWSPLWEYENNIMQYHRQREEWQSEFLQDVGSQSLLRPLLVETPAHRGKG